MVDKEARKVYNEYWRRIYNQKPKIVYCETCGKILDTLRTIKIHEKRGHVLKRRWRK